MPKVNEDGTELKFKILPHYFEDIKAGRKQADLRVLDNRWSAVLNTAHRVVFVHTESGEEITKEIRSIEEVGPPGLLRLFADIGEVATGRLWLIVFKREV